MQNSVEVGGIAADRLRSIVERIERNREEIKQFQEHEKDLFAEGKHAGFDVKVLKLILAERKKDPEEVSEQETLLDLYRRALNMQPDLPLGYSSEERPEASVVSLVARA